MYINGVRSMANIRTINEIKHIENADTIELAVIDGWQVIIRKGEYKVGDKGIYISIDSWVPTSLAPFLTKPGKYPKVFNGVEGERLRTIKLRGALSQGLLLPLEVLGKCGISYAEMDEDLSEKLGIQKWEKEIPAQLRGTCRGNFPGDVPKTDEERIQNLTRHLQKWVDNELLFEVTEKLDGSSMTCYLDLDWEFHVCSRNIDLKETIGNTFWDTANRLQIGRKMIDSGLIGYALQGELIGEGIQGNPYKLIGHDYRVYKVWDVKGGRYLTPPERIALVEYLGLMSVPVLHEEFKIPPGSTIEDILKVAEGKSVLFNTEREGLVFKDTQSDLSWKAISNKFLLKMGE